MRKPEQPDPVAFAKDCRQWPQWPWLPVKKGYTPQLIGLIHADDEGPYRVWDLNLFEVGYFPAESAPVHATYPTLEKLFSDGWVVD